MVKRSDGDGSRGRIKDGERTRSRLLDAAFRTLVEVGYAGASARVIATKAGVNPALVFYHYGGVDELLLAALRRSSDGRLARYREILVAEQQPDELVRKAADLFREDVEEGHVSAATEMLGASLAKPELRPALIEEVRRWLALTDEVIGPRLEGSPLADVLPTEPVAFAVVAAYLGLNMLSRLMPGSTETEALFGLVGRVAALVPLER